MTQEFMDVNFFVREASNRTQKQFNWDFSLLVKVWGVDATQLTTQCKKTLIINWEKGYYKSYEVITQEEKNKRNKVSKIIDLLTQIDVDGETMQYILDKVGMSDQMLKQLISTADQQSLDYYLTLRSIAEGKIVNKKVASY